MDKTRKLSQKVTLLLFVKNSDKAPYLSGDSSVKLDYTFVANNPTKSERVYTMKKMNRSTGNLLMCILEVILGILLLIDPVGFTSGIITVLGILLTLVGIKSLVGYFRQDAEEASENSGLAKGLIFVLIGLFCMFKSEWFIVTFPILTMFYGILTLVTGISKVQWAIDMLRQKQKYWFVAILGAVLTLVFAVLILCNPFSSTAFLWTFIAVSLIIEAIVDILAFIFSKK